MMDNLEMYIIHYTVFVEIGISCLLLREICLMIDEILNESKSTMMPVRCADDPNVFELLLKSDKNSDTLASPSYLYKLIISLLYKSLSFAKAWFSKFINTQRVFVNESSLHAGIYVNWFGYLNLRNGQDRQCRSDGRQIRCVFDEHLMNTLISAKLSGKIFRDMNRFNNHDWTSADMWLWLCYL
jgi:hypothetical protein